LGCDPLITRREPRSALLRPLLRGQGLAVHQPLIAHRLPVSATDLERVTPSAHVVLERLADPLAVRLRERGAMARILGRNERVRATLLGARAILLGLKAPVGGGKPLLIGKVATKLAAFCGNAAR
jgi:hypothetical protein